MERPNRAPVLPRIWQKKQHEIPINRLTADKKIRILIPDRFPTGNHPKLISSPSSHPPVSPSNSAVSCIYLYINNDLTPSHFHLTAISLLFPGLGAHRLPSMKGAPPPVTPCAAQVPFRLCLRQSPGTASVRWCGLRFALPTARLATPRLLPGAAGTTGQQAGDFESPHGSQNRPSCSRRLW